MADSDSRITKKEKQHAALKDLWDLYCSIHAERGLNIRELWDHWASQKRNSLRDFGADRSFDELCRTGCNSLPLAITIALMRPLQSLEDKWCRITGSSRNREQKIRAMEKAAATLEELLAAMADVVVKDYQTLLGPEILTGLQNEIVNPANITERWPSNAPAPHPATIIHALRTYASLLRAFDSIGDDTGAISTAMFSKYLISSYVYRVTGKYHDAEVSDLISATLDTLYDESAHRMWRSRNFQRIDHELSGLAQMLVDFGAVLDSRT